MSTEPICPECQAGKHPNCDGTAWNFEADEMTTCKCQDPEHRASLPYAGTQGYSGSETSRERAVEEAANGTARDRQQWVLGRLRYLGPSGITVKDLREQTGWHHGQASSVLSVLHKDGRLRRLTHRRDRCQVYVLPEHTLGRECVPHRSNRDREKEAWAAGFRYARQVRGEIGPSDALMDVIYENYKKEQK